MSISDNKEIRFIEDGSNINLQVYTKGLVSSKLNPAVYYVKQYPMGGPLYFKHHSSKIELPDKLYGSTPGRVDRIINTYEKRERSTGVLFTGIKGAGKTLLAGAICNEMIQCGYPVVMIDQPFAGSSFNEFIEAIGECVVLFDEFGKTYNNDDGKQDDLLSLLDGVVPGKRMFIFTENGIESINNYLIHRPGRVFYHYHFDKLEESVIEPYCKDLGLDGAFIDNILSQHKRTENFSFDMLKGICDEKLRYDALPFMELIAPLNIPTEPRRFKINTIKMFKQIKGERVQVVISESDTNFPIIIETEYGPEHASFDLYFNEIDDNGKPVMVKSSTKGKAPIPRKISAWVTSDDRVHVDFEKGEIAFMDQDWLVEATLKEDFSVRYTYGSSGAFM